MQGGPWGLLKCRQSHPLLDPIEKGTRKRLLLVPFKTNRVQPAVVCPYRVKIAGNLPCKLRFQGCDDLNVEFEVEIVQVSPRQVCRAHDGCQLWPATGEEQLAVKLFTMGVVPSDLNPALRCAHQLVGHRSVGYAVLFRPEGILVGIKNDAYAHASRCRAEQGANDDVAAAGWFAPDEIPPDLAFASTKSLIARWQQGLL